MIAILNKLSIFPCLFYIFYLLPASLYGQDNTRVKVSSEWYRQMLPKNFSLNEKFEVWSVLQEDLNSDKKKDRIIFWSKVKYTPGDTIFTTIYFKFDTTFQFIGTFDNLFCPVFEYWHTNTTGNEVLDSLRMLYPASNFEMAEFKTNVIKIAVPMSYHDGVDFYFYLDHKQNRWFLKKAQPYMGSKYVERKLGKMMKVDQEIPMEEFNILSIMGY